MPINTLMEIESAPIKPSQSQVRLTQGKNDFRTTDSLKKFIAIYQFALEKNNVALARLQYQVQLNILQIWRATLISPLGLLAYEGHDEAVENFLEHFPEPADNLGTGLRRSIGHAAEGYALAGKKDKVNELIQRAKNENIAFGIKKLVIRAYAYQGDRNAVEELLITDERLLSKALQGYARGEHHLNKEIAINTLLILPLKQADDTDGVLNCSYKSETRLVKAFAPCTTRDELAWIEKKYGEIIKQWKITYEQAQALSLYKLKIWLLQGVKLTEDTSHPYFLPYEIYLKIATLLTDIDESKMDKLATVYRKNMQQCFFRVKSAGKLADKPALGFHTQKI